MPTITKPAKAQRDQSTVIFASTCVKFDPLKWSLMEFPFYRHYILAIRRFSLKIRDSFFIFLKTHFENNLELPLFFFLKRKQNKKEKPK